MPDWTDPQFPTYSVANDTANGSVVHNKLHDDLMGVISNVLETVTIDGDVIRLHYDSEVASGDRATVDAVVAHADADLQTFQPRHLEEEYSLGMLQARRWYARDNAGTLSGLVEEWAYTYQDGALTSERHRTFDYAGVATLDETFNLNQVNQSSTLFIRRIL